MQIFNFKLLLAFLPMCSMRSRGKKKCGLEVFILNTT